MKAALRAGVQHVLLVSSMGTTQPDSYLDKLADGHVMWYKLNGWCCAATLFRRICLQLQSPAAEACMPLLVLCAPALLLLAAEVHELACSHLLLFLVHHELSHASMISQAMNVL